MLNDSIKIVETNCSQNYNKALSEVLKAAKTLDLFERKIGCLAGFSDITVSEVKEILEYCRKSVGDCQ